MTMALQHPRLPPAEEVAGEEAVAVPVGPPAAPRGLDADKSVGGWRGSRVHDVLAAIDVPRRTARPSAALRVAPAFEGSRRPRCALPPQVWPRRSHGLGLRSHGPGPDALQSSCAGRSRLRMRGRLQRCCMQAALVPPPTDERTAARRTPIPRRLPGAPELRTARRAQVANASRARRTAQGTPPPKRKRTASPGFASRTTRTPFGPPGSPGAPRRESIGVLPS